MARTQSYKKRRKERNWDRAIIQASKKCGPVNWLAEEIERQRKTRVFWKGKRVGAKRRRQIFERDGKCCCACGYSKSEYWLSMHHVMPRRLGGTNHISNLKILCTACHESWNLVEGQSRWYWYEWHEWLELAQLYYRTEELDVIPLAIAA